MFGLTSQIRRASVSVSSNLAEGSGRMSCKEKAHFSTIAYGSLTEVVSQWYVALDEGYVSDVEFQELYEKMAEIGRMFNALRNSQLS